MPFKANAARCHRIPKQRHRVTNWAEYDTTLRRRGSLTVWFSDEAIAAWRAEPRTTRGGQPHYSALAIKTALRRCHINEFYLSILSLAPMPDHAFSMT